MLRQLDTSVDLQAGAAVRHRFTQMNCLFLVLNVALAQLNIAGAAIKFAVN
jgi:hypothetical protein